MRGKLEKSNDNENADSTRIFVRIGGHIDGHIRELALGNPGCPAMPSKELDERIRGQGSLPACMGPRNLNAGKLGSIKSKHAQDPKAEGADGWFEQNEIGIRV